MDAEAHIKLDRLVAIQETMARGLQGLSDSVVLTHRAITGPLMELVSTIADAQTVLLERTGEEPGTAKDNDLERALRAMARALQDNTAAIHALEIAVKAGRAP